MAETQLNPQVTTTPGLSPEMKTYYTDRLIDHADPNLVYDQFGDHTPIPAGSGKTVEFRKYSPLAKALTPLTEGVTPDGMGLNVTTVTGTVNQYGAYVTISDVLDLTAIDRNLEQATKLLGSQAGRTLDTVTREVVCGGTNVMYAPTVTESGTTENLSRSAVGRNAPLTVELLFKAAAKLRSMNAQPVDDAFVAIVHPNVACDLMLSDKWVDVHKYANPEKIYKGEVGMLAGIRIIQSTEAKIVPLAGANGDSVYLTMVVGANAYGVTEVTGGGLSHIIKQLGSGGASDPLNQRATTGWKALRTAVRLVEEYMVRIEHGSPSAPKAAGN